MQETLQSPLAIERLLKSVQAGVAGSLFVVGGPGLGKSRLAERTRQLAAGQFLLGTAAGATRGIGKRPFALLDELLGTLATAAGREPPPLAETGRRPAPGQALRFLREVATQPVLLVVDDLQGSDAASLRALDYVVHRVAALPIGLVAYMRPWPWQGLELALAATSEGLGEVAKLAPLSVVETASLLNSMGARRWRGADAQIVWRACAGNPLLVEQVALGTVAINGKYGDLETTRTQAIPRQALVARFVGVSGSIRAYADAAAVFGSRFRVAVVPETASLSDDAADVALRGLLDNGVLADEGAGWARFSQPVLRRLLYEELPSALRSRLHTAALGSLMSRGVGAAEAAVHALESHRFGDPAAVSVLEEAASEALIADEPERARHLLQAAVRLAGKSAPAGLLLMLSEVLLTAGALEEATQLQRRVLRQTGTVVADRVRAQRLLGRAVLSAGRPAHAVRALEAAVQEALPAGGRDLVEALLDLAEMLWLAEGARRAAVVVDHALSTMASEAPELGPRIEIAAAFMRLVGGDPSGLAAAEAAISQAELEPEPPARGNHLAWPPVRTYLRIMTMVERFDAVDRAFDMATAAESSSPPQWLVLDYADSLRRRGQLATARDMVLGLAQHPRLDPDLRPWLSVQEAEIDFDLGLLREARAAARIVEEMKGPLPPILEMRLLKVRAALQLSAGHVGAACELYDQLRELAESAGISEPCAVPWARDAVDAYLAADRRPDADRLLTRLEQAAEVLPCTWPRLGHAAGLAACAERDGDVALAERAFQAVLQLGDQLGMPLQSARTLLEYGRFLRRTGRPRAARPYLTRALHVAEDRGAAGLSALTYEELRAAGGRRRAARARYELSSQEARVARLAEQDLTNAEIGRQLGISAKTVESHLRAVYRKLNVRSRRELLILRSGERRSEVAPARRS